MLIVEVAVGVTVFAVVLNVFFVLSGRRRQPLGKVDDGHVPILSPGVSVYSNPLPHVLILTAIVVGVATTAVGLALLVRIREAYGTVEENEIQAMNAEDGEHESACGQHKGEACASVGAGEEAQMPLESAAPFSEGPIPRRTSLSPGKGVKERLPNRLNEQ